jgi:secondary thiamine-phosphate synthase enzyme
MIQTIEVRTTSKTELLDITHAVEEAIRKVGVEEGVCFLFVPHTTAAITVNEHADPSVAADLLSELEKIVPAQGRYRHLEGNAPAHVKASLIGPSETVLIRGKRLLLGTWQGVFFCEFDGPRRRQVHIQIVGT